MALALPHAARGLFESDDDRLDRLLRTRQVVENEKFRPERWHDVTALMGVRREIRCCDFDLSMLPKPPANDWLWMASPLVSTADGNWFIEGCFFHDSSHGVYLGYQRPLIGNAYGWTYSHA